jgi:hypothetical protein
MEAWKEAWLRDTIGYTVLELPNGNHVLTWNFRYRVEAGADLTKDGEAIVDALRGMSGTMIEAQLKMIRAIIAIDKAESPEELASYFESEGTYAMAEEARIQ